MKEDEIRRLVKIVEDSNIGQLEISRWGKTIKISKSPHDSNTYHNSTMHTGVNPIATVPPAAVPPAIPTAEPKAVEEKSKADGKIVDINAPMVGTFYRSPAPDADPYVEVNQTIKKGQVICIIEAMKLMNEIESEFDGRIVEAFVENGQPVEYNQSLFRIEQS